MSELVIINVSIIIPVYNAEKYLRKCLDSIINQTYKSFECILVDDASTDNSLFICEEYVNTDKRFKVIHNNKNIGCPQSRKVGLEIANADYILFFDSDDWLELNMIENLYSKILNCNDEIKYDLVYCNYYTCDKLNAFKNLTGFDNISLLKEWFSGGICSAVKNKLVKKDLYNKIIFPTCFYDEDCVITVQLLFFTDKIGYVNKALYHNSYNPDSGCNDIKRKFKNIIDQCTNMCLIYNFLYEKYKENINIFNPGLNNRINSIRNQYLRFKELRYNYHEIFSNTIPKSVFNIFKSSLKLYQKCLLYLALNNIKWPYNILDILRLIRNKIKSLIKKN